MPPRLINIEHIGDVDLEPSSESLNLKGETRPQLTSWHIKITESTINTMILILKSIHGIHKFASKVYSTKYILSSNSSKFATTKVSLYMVYYYSSLK